ncbi:hypothetical protein F5Y05DRAFT_243286 [Hypoxylon sp. FL0543]|nr:hypothetical protein F5Y05DRAFT_243286 [Hypoxylon sp. FL0543]
MHIKQLQTVQAAKAPLMHPHASSETWSHQLRPVRLCRCGRFAALGLWSMRSALRRFIISNAAYYVCMVGVCIVGFPRKREYDGKLEILEPSCQFSRPGPAWFTDPHMRNRPLLYHFLHDLGLPEKANNAYRYWCAASATACPSIRKSADNRMPVGLNAEAVQQRCNMQMPLGVIVHSSYHVEVASSGARTQGSQMDSDSTSSR